MDDWLIANRICQPLKKEVMNKINFENSIITAPKRHPLFSQHHHTHKTASVQLSSHNNNKNHVFNYHCTTKPIQCSIILSSHTLKTSRVQFSSHNHMIQKNQSCFQLSHTKNIPSSIIIIIAQKTNLFTDHYAHNNPLFNYHRTQTTLFNHHQCTKRHVFNYHTQKKNPFSCSIIIAQKLKRILCSIIIAPKQHCSITVTAQNNIPFSITFTAPSNILGSIIITHTKKPIRFQSRSQCDQLARCRKRSST